MTATNPSRLAGLGFRYKRSMSERGESVYEYVFPVYRYHTAIVLECRLLVISETGELTIDIFDSGSHGMYAPWYYDESGIHSKIIEVINNNIKKELHRMKITLEDITDE